MTVAKLEPDNAHATGQGPIALIILDGIGYGAGDESDGVAVAHTPVMDKLFREGLSTRLKAHGVAVGLPSDGDMGNSEVGHNAIGAGRIFSQGAKLVNEALENGDIFNGNSWRTIQQRCAAGGVFHLIGLVSDGNVHSHIDHLYKILAQCRTEGFREVRIHGLLDGRDVEPKSALNYFGPLESACRDYQQDGYNYCVASGGGRMVTTMDRYEADWSIVEKGWQAHVLGQARTFGSAIEAIQTFYDEDPEITDQYLDSFVVSDEKGPIGTINDGDSVVLFNFRGDRAIELSLAFEQENFNKFERQRFPEVFYAGMMQYDGDAQIPAHFLVEPPSISGTVSEFFCASGLKTFAISETQKYGHVTYFWNGNKSGYINQDLETYIEIESDRVTFDKRPWMKAAEITDNLIEAIECGEYQFLRANYANGDMVGHTGNPESIRIAVETVDLCLGRLLRTIEKAGGIAVITADHGNADQMFIEKNGIRTPMVAHTKNPVPFVIKDFAGKNTYNMTDLSAPGLANIAATLCVLLGFIPPHGYEPALVQHNEDR